MTRLSPDEKCARCGSLLYPPQLAIDMKIAATAAYVCLNCGRAYKSTGNPPKLTVLSPVAIAYDENDEE